MGEIDRQVESSSIAQARRRYDPVRQPGGKRHVVHVRMSDEQYLLVRQRADALGQSMSRVLVEAAIRPVDTRYPDRLELLEFTDQLRAVKDQVRGVTANINQLAHWANSMQTPPSLEEMQQVLRDARWVITQCHTVIGRVKR